jgi:TPR repeat protein
VFSPGTMHTTGEGVPQNDAEAVKWYRLAAEQGNADAQFAFGVMYEKGEGVPKDYILAHMWFNLAASRGSSSGTKNRDIVAGFMTRAQIAEAQQRAWEWKPKIE